MSKSFLRPDELEMWLWENNDQEEAISNYIERVSALREERKIDFSGKWIHRATVEHEFEMHAFKLLLKKVRAQFQKQHMHRPARIKAIAEAIGHSWQDVANWYSCGAIPKRDEFEKIMQELKGLS